MDSKTITKEIENLQSLENLANAYARISSGRMKKTRDEVLVSRDFLFEIQAIFAELQASYREEFLALARKKGFKNGQKITFLSHNGRSVAVFISANTSFYGDLTKKVFDMFLKDVREQHLEATIVGNLGVSMFREAAPDKSYSYFDLPDYGFDREKMSELIKHLVQYEEIHIYYGKFKSIITQSPDKVVISAQTTSLKSNKNVEIVKYLFEPSLEDILVFFEREMFSSIFEQTITESQLAKFASRMVAMDQAGEKIRNELSTIKTTKLRMMHNLSNKKQLDFLSSVMAVRRTL
ncbi:ATP synthase F1 subunit gamma [soil metagenome]